MKFSLGCVLAILGFNIVLSGCTPSGGSGANPIDNIFDQHPDAPQKPEVPLRGYKVFSVSNSCKANAVILKSEDFGFLCPGKFQLYSKEGNLKKTVPLPQRVGDFLVLDNGGFLFTELSPDRELRYSFLNSQGQVQPLSGFGDYPFNVDTVIRKPNRLIFGGANGIAVFDVSGVTPKLITLRNDLLRDQSSYSSALHSLENGFVLAAYGVSLFYDLQGHLQNKFEGNGLVSAGRLAESRFFVVSSPSGERISDKKVYIFDEKGNVQSIVEQKQSGPLTVLPLLQDRFVIYDSAFNGTGYLRFYNSAGLLKEFEVKTASNWFAAYSHGDSVIYQYGADVSLYRAENKEAVKLDVSPSGTVVLQKFPDRTALIIDRTEYYLQLTGLDEQGHKTWSLRRDGSRILTPFSNSKGENFLYVGYKVLQIGATGITREVKLVDQSTWRSVEELSAGTYRVKMESSIADLNSDFKIQQNFEIGYQVLKEATVAQLGAQRFLVRKNYSSNNWFLVAPLSPDYKPISDKTYLKIDENHFALDGARYGSDIYDSQNHLLNHIDESVQYLKVVSGGQLLVHDRDFNNERFLLFTNEGKLLKTFKLAGLGRSYDAGPWLMSDGTLLVAHSSEAAKSVTFSKVSETGVQASYKAPIEVNYFSGNDMQLGIFANGSIGLALRPWGWNKREFPVLVLDAGLKVIAEKSVSGSEVKALLFLEKLDTLVWEERDEQYNLHLHALNSSGVANEVALGFSDYGAQRRSISVWGANIGFSVDSTLYFYDRNLKPAGHFEFGQGRFVSYPMMTKLGLAPGYFELGTSTWGPSVVFVTEDLKSFLGVKGKRWDFSHFARDVVRFSDHQLGIAECGLANFSDLQMSQGEYNAETMNGRIGDANLVKYGSGYLYAAKDQYEEILSFGKSQCSFEVETQR